MIKRGSGYPWHYALFIVSYYSTNGIHQGFIAKFYQSLGMTGLPFMLLMAAMPAVAVFAQPFWGKVSDSLPTRNRALWWLAAASLVMMLLFKAGTSFAWLLMTALVFSFFFTPLQPLGDSIVLEEMGRRRLPYGPVRLIGSYGFALTNLLVARFFEGRFQVVPWAIAIAICVMMATIPVLPRLPGHQRGREKVPFRTVFSLPYMKPLIVLVTLLMLTMGFFYSYFTIHFTSLPGATAGLAGLAYFISAVSETPFLLMGDRLLKRFGAGRLIASAGLAMALRFFLLGTFPSVVVALSTQVLHGWCFMVIAFSMSKYISEVVPDEQKAQGQTVLAVVGFGLSRIFGIFVGGSLASWLGGPMGGFLAMSALALVTAIGFLVYFLHQPTDLGGASAAV